MMKHRKRITTMVLALVVLSAIAAIRLLSCFYQDESEKTYKNAHASGLSL